MRYNDSYFLPIGIKRSNSKRSMASDSMDHCIDNNASFSSHLNTDDYHIFLEDNKPLNNWVIPKVKDSYLYKHSTFSFHTDYVIKTIEQLIPIGKEYESLHLINTDMIK